MGDDQQQELIQTACETALTFVHEHYYKRVDEKRHIIGKLYLDTATMSYNGTKIAGAADIQKFFQELLPSTVHTVTSVDAQPVPSAAVDGQTTIAVQTAGIVRYGRKEPRPFQQTFLITAQDTNWKVATDTFRFQDVK